MSFGVKQANLGFLLFPLIHYRIQGKYTQNLLDGLLGMGTHDEKAHEILVMLKAAF